MGRRLLICLGAAVIFLASGAGAFAQFSTVLNFPPDVVPGSIGDGTQANLFDGGAIGANFTAQAGSELNVSGGTVGNGLSVFGVANISGGSIGNNANAGGVVNITGGRIGTDFDVGGSAAVDVSGGVIGGYSDIYTGSQVTISGGAWSWPMVIRGGEVIAVGDEFLLDGAPVAGLADLGDEVTVTVPAGSVLAGTLADGTPTAYSTFLSFDETPTVTLRRSAVPAAMPGVVTLPGAAAPKGVRGGETLVVGDGGAVGDHFRVGAGGELHVAGGSVGEQLLVVDGRLRVTGGMVGEDVVALGAGAVIDVEGGRLSRYTFAASGATINVSGGRVDDAARVFAGGTLNVTGGKVGERLIARGAVVNVSGGEIEADFEATAGTEVNVSSGTIHGGFTLGGGKPNVLNLSGSGSVSGPFSADAWATVNMTGGFMGGLSIAGHSSEWNISGGYVYDQFTVGNGNGSFNVTGGTIGNRFKVAGQAVLAGGAYGDSFTSQSFSKVDLVGSDFRIDGAPISGLEATGNEVAFNVPTGGLLTGRLQDGTPFAFTSGEGDVIANGTLKLRRGADLPPQPSVVEVVTPSNVLGVGEGQTLVVGPGGAIGAHAGAGRGSNVRVVGGNVGANFEAVDANVEIVEGSVGEGFDAFGSTVTIFGGAVGRLFEAKPGSRVDICGGSIGQDFVAHGGSVVNIAGGSGYSWFRARGGSEVNISGPSHMFSFQAEAGSKVNVTGGTTGLRFTAFDDSEVTISGGTIGDSFWARAGSSVTLRGTEFFLDGTPIALSYNMPLTIAERDKKLTGTLADGTPFDLVLYDSAASSDDVDPLATLRVVKVYATADFDRDGDVDPVDLASWRAGFGQSAGATRIDGDTDGDADVDGRDFLAWQRHGRKGGSGSVAGVPEPASTALWAAAMAGGLATARRREIDRRRLAQ